MKSVLLGIGPQSYEKKNDQPNNRRQQRRRCETRWGPRCGIGSEKKKIAHAKMSARHMFLFCCLTWQNFVTAQCPDLVSFCLQCGIKLKTKTKKQPQKCTIWNAVQFRITCGNYHRSMNKMASHKFTANTEMRLKLQHSPSLASYLVAFFFFLIMLKLYAKCNLLLVGVHLIAGSDAL